MSDEVVIEFQADGTVTAPELGLSCKPPGMTEYRVEDGKSFVVMWLEDRTLTPELINDLIDMYEFFQKTVELRIEFR